MSSTVASMSISELLEQRTLIDTQICIITGGAVSGSTKIKLTKGGKVKKAPSSRKGQATANGDFIKKIFAEHKDAIKEFKDANPDQKGAHLSFVSNYKKEHAEEWEAFKLAWAEAHPKEAADDASDDGNTMVTASSGSEKPKKVLSPEHIAKMQAGRKASKEAKEAAKGAPAAETFSATTVVVAAAPAPMAAPAKKPVKKAAKKAEPIVAPVAIVSAAPAEATVAEEDDSPELIPFKHGGITYMRLGSKREDGNHLWATADLWANKKGVKGDYVGAIQEDGVIDTDALEPLLE